MARFPYFGFPFQHPYYRYYNQNQYHNYNHSEKQQNTDLQISNSNSQNDNSQSHNNANTEEASSSVQNRNSLLNTRKMSSPKINNLFSLPFAFDFNGLSDSDSPIIEAFGIKLYLDDIIILCLLFLLYKEDVRDEMLFIALILLLLS